MFWFFGLEACGILAPQPGIEHTLPSLEDEVLTTGPPGNWIFNFVYILISLNLKTNAQFSYWKNC